MCKNPEMLTYDWTKNGGQVRCDMRKHSKSSRTRRLAIRARRSAFMLSGTNSSCTEHGKSPYGVTPSFVTHWVASNPLPFV